MICFYFVEQTTSPVLIVSWFTIIHNNRRNIQPDRGCAHHRPVVIASLSFSLSLSLSLSLGLALRMRPLRLRTPQHSEEDRTAGGRINKCPTWRGIKLFGGFGVAGRGRNLEYIYDYDWQIKSWICINTRNNSKTFNCIKKAYCEEYFGMELNGMQQVLPTV